MMTGDFMDTLSGVLGAVGGWVAEHPDTVGTVGGGVVGAAVGGVPGVAVGSSLGGAIGGYFKPATAEGWTPVQTNRGEYQVKFEASGSGPVLTVRAPNGSQARVSFRDAPGLLQSLVAAM